MKTHMGANPGATRVIASPRICQGGLHIAQAPRVDDEIALP